MYTTALGELYFLYLSDFSIFGNISVNHLLSNYVEVLLGILLFNSKMFLDIDPRSNKTSLIFRNFVYIQTVGFLYIEPT